MKTLHHIPENYLDIVFAGRNKNYGAYELRKNYTNSLKKAMGVIFGISAVITLFAFTNKPKVTPTKRTIACPLVVSNLIIKPKEIIKIIPRPPVSTAPPPPPMRVIDAKNLAIVKILPVTPPVPKLPGVAIPKGPSGPMASGPITNPVAPSGPISTLPAGPSNTKPTIAESGTIVLDVNPSYPGGEAALKQFLESHLQYPEEALSSSVEGNVRIAFQINEKGELSNVRILKKLGAGCDEEAKRVLKLMPKWNPGIFNGKAVSSEWEIPMNFQLN
jgi:periplasmic protein TonB